MDIIIEKSDIAIKQDNILSLKLKLQRTDYLALKYAEGEITASEYAPTLAKRRAWRAEINALETEIAALKES